MKSCNESYRKDDYLKKLVSVADAAKLVKSGHHISTGMASSVPIELLNALCGRKDELEDVHIYSGLTFYPSRSCRAPSRGTLSITLSSSPGKESSCTRGTSRSAPSP